MAEEFAVKKKLSDFFRKHNIKIKLKQNAVYALVGESGTGKSYRAKLVAERYGLSAIIDDGLLIQNDKIVAGHSAKREKTYMGAVRVALFDNKDHRDEIVHAIKKMHITRILLIGTSEKMVHKIAAHLQLEPPDNIIHIQDIATKDEIEKAMRSRQIEGKHVIPVPSFEVKRSYPQIFSDSIKLFFARKKLFSTRAVNETRIFEKSIVQPEFSKKSRIEISGAVLSKMVSEFALECNPYIIIKKISIKTDLRGYRITITIDVFHGVQLAETASALEKYIIEKIEMQSGILIEEVSIIIDKVRREDAENLN